MIKEAEARAVVESYIGEWHARWKSVKAAFAKNVDFDRWGKLVDEVDRAHFVPGIGSGAEGSYGSPPDHDPATEKVTGFVPEKDGVARIETERADTVSTYWEYELRLVKGKPRIAKMRRFLDPKGTPLIQPAEAKKILNAPSLTAELGALARGVSPNGDVLFKPGRSVTIHGEEHRTEVRDLGKLTVESGVLAARDFTYDGHGLAAFARKVKPGSYPVDAAIVASRVAALRVRFGSAKVVHWHPASFAKQGHVVGVDAANVAVFDAASFVDLDAWEKERLSEDNIVNVPRPNARLITLRRKDDCAIVESGWGDGGYPCYWGVDANKNIVRLFIDFLVAATFLEETARIEWKGSGKLEHSLLDEWKVKVAFQKGSLVARGDAFKRARLLQGKKVLADTDRLGLGLDGDKRTYDLEPNLVGKPLTVEITLSTGYRNG